MILDLFFPARHVIVKRDVASIKLADRSCSTIFDLSGMRRRASESKLGGGTSFRAVSKE